MIDAELNEIKRLINEEFASDVTIMRKLNIPNTTYYRNKKKLYKQEIKILEHTRAESLEHDLMQTRRTLDFIIEKCKQIADSDKAYNSEKIAALELMGRAAYARVDSLYGPTHIKPKLNKIVQDVKAIAVKQ